MVTCRQIQELTKARLEGSVPSYPEQWIEGPMARRDRAMMRRGMLRRRLPKVKGAAKQAARSPSPPGSAGNGRPPSPNRGHVPMRGPKTQVLGSGKAGGEGDEPTSLALPLKPLRWPRVRDEQLQTVCSIKRMLKELHAYLQANSSTLVEALPRRSVNGEGFVSIVTLHRWLCSLKREPGNGPTGVEGLRLSLTPDAETIRSRALAVRSQYARGKPIPPAVIRSMVNFLDREDRGVILMADFMECFRVAKRLALDLDRITPSKKDLVVLKSQQEEEKARALEQQEQTIDEEEEVEEVDKELSWYDEDVELTQRRKVKEAATEGDEDAQPSLASSYGAVNEADVHELVDVLFSEYDELLLQELEASSRVLKRLWAVAREGHRYGYRSRQEGEEKERALAASYKPISERDSVSTFRGEAGTGSQLPTGADDPVGLLEGAEPPLHVARVFVALDDYLATTEGMRFMEFVKMKSAPQASVFAVGSGIAEAYASVHDVRAVLAALFEGASRVEDAKRAREAARAAKTALLALEMEAAAPSGASSIEQQMKRAGIDSVFRRVEFLTARRGLRLRDVCELMDTENSGTVGVAKIVAFMQAISLRTPPPSYEAARVKNADKAAVAAAANAARAKEELDFTIRMRAAEESGCFASFALLDRYFCRFQLKAEDIWYHGRAKKEGFRRAAECKTDDSDALAAGEFHKLLLQAKVSLTFEQVKKLVAYLDTDGSGKIEHDELQAAILDYRRFKRAKQRLELKRASAERRLFLDRQVLLLLQYLVLVGEGNKLKDQQYQAYATAALGNANANEAKDEALRETMAQVGPNGPHDQFINVVDMQRAIEKSSNLAIAQYFREVRERLHSDAYQQLREINN